MEGRKDYCQRTAGLFVALGTANFMVLFLAMSSAQDILVGTSLPTSTTILCLMLPFFLWTILAPHLIPRIPCTVRILFACATDFAGVALVAAPDQMTWKLVGLVLISLGSGIGETSFLALTAFYNDIAVKAYAGGTGLGVVLGPLYYTGMTAWGCVRPDHTILGVLVLPILLAALFIVLTRDGNSNGPESYKGVEYSALTSASQENQPITAWRKAQTIWKSTPKMIALLIGVTCELLMVSAIATTVVFLQAPFTPREHYLYYFSTYAAGVMFGRLYALLVSLVVPSLDVLVEKTWILTTFLVVNIILNVCNSWYRFIPSVWIVLLLVFVHGIASGALYMNTFATAGKFESDARLREISRAFTTLGSGGGMVLAGLAGLWIENALKGHCYYQTGSLDICLTRSVFNVTGQCGV